MSSKYKSVEAARTVSWGDIHNYVKRLGPPGPGISIEHYLDLLREFFSDVEDKVLTTLRETHPSRIEGLTSTKILIGKGYWKIQATGKVLEEDPKVVAKKASLRAQIKNLEKEIKALNND